MSRYPLVDLIDRERDESYRQHLFADHEKAFAFEVSHSFLANVAKANFDTCDDCESYALSVGAEEGQ